MHETQPIKGIVLASVLALAFWLVAAGIFVWLS